ncbi:hypothetical protein Tco_0134603 [Tanacetum coccineum]
MTGVPRQDPRAIPHCKSVFGTVLPEKNDLFSRKKHKVVVTNEEGNLKAYLWMTWLLNIKDEEGSPVIGKKHTEKLKVKKHEAESQKKFLGLVDNNDKLFGYKVHSEDAKESGPNPKKTEGHIGSLTSSKNIKEMQRLIGKLAIFKSIPRWPSTCYAFAEIAYEGRIEKKRYDDEVEAGVSYAPTPSSLPPRDK